MVRHQSYFVASRLYVLGDLVVVDCVRSAVVPHLELAEHLHDCLPGGSMVPPYR